MRWWTTGLVLAAALAASAAEARPWQGFLSTDAAPGNGTGIVARGDARRIVVRRCWGTAVGPCLVRDAVLALTITPWPDDASRASAQLGGTLALAGGPTCTLAGDVWRVAAGGRRVRDGALTAQVTCPAGAPFGVGWLRLSVRGARMPEMPE
jgi:hypothetical protein